MRNDISLLIRGVEPVVWSHRLAFGKQIVGRSHHCEIRLADPTVSRRHAQIERGATALHIRDLGSMNGTFVNERSVPRDSASPFTLGDAIRVGHVILDVLSGAAGMHPPNEEELEDSTPHQIWRDTIEEMPGTEDITDRDAQVLGLLLKGYSEKQVALALEIKRTTVHSHIANIYQALGVHSRGELLSLFLGTHTTTG